MSENINKNAQLRERIPRSKSLIMPTIKNPFVHKIKLSSADKIRIAIMSVTIAPIRAILAILFLLVDWLFCSLIVYGQRDKNKEEKQPLTGWRRSLQRVVMVLGRIHLALFGFHWITVRGQKAPTAEAHILVVAPHTTLLDAFMIFVCRGITSGVSREENGKVPIFRTLVDSLQPVYVSRTDPNSRLKTIQEINRRCEPGSQWPQIVIFPEGTCTNGSCLITFKGGAFYPGVPVQPVAIRYLNKLDTFTWTWDGPSALTVLWLSLCNFSNKLEVTFLPVYTPNEAEKQDPKLFARNVRAVMARALDRPVTDHTFEDCRLMLRAQKMGLPSEVGLVEFQKLLSKLGVKMDELQEKLKDYSEIAKSGGYIGVEDLAKYLQLPVSPALEEVFSLYDRDSSGKIDFREYVIGCSLVTQPVNNDETLQLAFSMFGGEKAYIVLEDMSRIMESAFGMGREESERLFNEADTNNSGTVTYDEFNVYIQKKPEYAKLFTTYQRLATLPETIEADFKNTSSTTGEQSRTADVSGRSQCSSKMDSEKKRD